MNWDDLWFAFPNFSRERAMLLAIAWREVAEQGDSALLANLQMNTLDGFGVLYHLRYAGIRVPADALQISLHSPQPTGHEKLSKIIPFS